MTAIRVLLGALGLAAIGWGAWLASARDVEDLIATGVWLGVGVVAHDFVLAPIVLVLWWVARTVLPAAMRGPVALGALVLGSATLLAIPVLGRFGERPDNPTLLDRDYTGGWLMLAALVLVAVALASIAQAVRGRRESDHAV